MWVKRSSLLSHHFPIERCYHWLQPPAANYFPHNFQQIRKYFLAPQLLGISTTIQGRELLQQLHHFNISVFYLAPPDWKTDWSKAEAGRCRFAEPVPIDLKLVVWLCIRYLPASDSPPDTNAGHVYLDIIFFCTLFGANWSREINRLDGLLTKLVSLLSLLTTSFSTIHNPCLLSWLVAPPDTFLLSSATKNFFWWCTVQYEYVHINNVLWIQERPFQFS